MNMKTKENLDSKNLPNDQTLLKGEVKKDKSLRPMRSMMAVRSLRPRTMTVSVLTKHEVMSERNV